jgi:hypothetical protein
MAFDTRSKRRADIRRKTPNPAERQILREMKPVLSDMLSDFRMCLRLKVPTHFTGGGVRDVFSNPKVVTMFDLSGKSRDAHGGLFFENEEVLISLLELDLESRVLHANSSQAFLHNSRVPVLRGSAHSAGWRARMRREFCMYPTKHMCREYLKKGESPPAR